MGGGNARTKSRKLPNNRPLLLHLERNVPLKHGRSRKGGKRICKVHFHSHESHKTIRLRKGETWTEVYFSKKYGLNLFDAAFTRAGDSDRTRRAINFNSKRATGEALNSENNEAINIFSKKKRKKHNSKNTIKCFKYTKY